MPTGRYEYKFPISVDTKMRFMEDARHALTEDPHGKNAIYRVSSQYFDTPDLTAYWEKLDGEKIRKKFRLRYYSFDEPGPIKVAAAFMEIKHRINNLVYKERVALTNEGADAILSEPQQLACLDDYIVTKDRNNRPILGTVARATATHGFTSVNVISYLREAWLGREDHRLRVTFDSCCRAYPPDAYLDVNATTGGRSILPENQYIMEIKFDNAVPRWIRDLILKHSISLQRFSKYAAGVEQFIPAR